MKKKFKSYDQGVIEKEVRKFYMNIYAYRPTHVSKNEIFKFIGNSKIKILTCNEVEKLEKSIDQQEVNNCLKTLLS